ncbi:hypothetical protein ACI7BZ_06255 [Xanthobacter sp. AM11]|uniref:hypothetical protein n=1 Tax=Xanthobacter sp. AM11 TaxID=3380643 RepID=UPI0039BFF8E4
MSAEGDSPCGHAEPTAVHTVPALQLAAGFRVLVMRELASGDGPSAFAVIDQALLRPPPRQIRHGLAFALAFRPQVMDWLAARLGRPGTRAGAAPAIRNPHWPRLAWHQCGRDWADGTRSTEWSADILFPDAGARAAFGLHFQTLLAGQPPA